MSTTTETAFKPVLIHRHDNRIKWAIDELREQYRQNAQALNQLREALAEFEGRQVGQLELITFLRHDDPKAYLLGKYVANQQLGGIPIKADKLEEFLEIPSYEHLLRMRHPFAGWSKEEIQAYYSETQKAFVSLEVSEEEKESITFKHSIYIYDEYHHRQYLAVKQVCEGLNFFNDWEGQNNITPAKLQETLLFLWPYVKARLEDGKFGKRYFWEVDFGVWG